METLLSLGLDIGTSTKQLVFSRLHIANQAGAWSVPEIVIADKEILHRSAVHFTPLRSNTVIDADGMTKTEYDELYALISAPTASHEVTMPHGAAGEMTFTAYVTGGEDEVTRIDADGRVWGNLKVQIMTTIPQIAV